MCVFPDLFIVIVNYNLKDDTIECIDSYLNSGAELDHIIIVDNASSDGSVDALVERYGPDLMIIQAAENRGYPHALNLGIPKALERGAQWVLLSNNDVIVDKKLLSELEKSSLTDPRVGLIGPLILYYEAPEIIWFLGHRIIPGTLIGVGFYRGKHVSDKLPPYVPTDMVHGCVMAVKRDVFETIGLFDDSQLIYGDDPDFCWRAKQKGFSAIGATRAKVWHKISLTMNIQKPRTRYLRIRNTIFFYRRYSRGLTYIIMVTFTFFRGIAMSIRDLLKRHTELIPPLWYGWWDGWLGKVDNRY